MTNEQCAILMALILVVGIAFNISLVYICDKNK